MPNGLWYAGGDYTTESGIPASAFSKGDPLQLTGSPSEVSRIEPGGTISPIAGVALSDSDQSIASFGEVVYLVPQPDTLFWASIATNVASMDTAFRPGVEYDLLFSLANNRYYVEDSSNTPRVRIVRGPGDIDQSVQSKVLVRLVYDGGSLQLD